MDQPLGVRLVAEALGTFLFFFLGFSGIAVLVDVGPEAITSLGIAAGFGRAALSAAGSFRARPTLSNGTSAVGATTRLAVSFQAPQ